MNIAQKISLSGIYDKRTLKFLLENGMNSFTFDFRPRSENFIQKYVLEDLIKLLDQQANSSHIKVYLYFQNEADFMIKDILSVFVDSSIKPILYLNCSEDTKYYDSFEAGINWYYDPDHKIDKVLKSKNLEAITFAYHFLEELYESGQLTNFLSNLNVQIFSNAKRKIRFQLSIDWRSNVSQAVLDYLDFENFMLPISRDLEVCYRNVDLPKLKLSIDSFRV